jgi:8-oxo-dGTP pyrophosphatase MutT (NUDIX family)
MNQALLRDSASVLLVKNSPSGYQALLVRKHAKLAFAGGSLVFPGGKVESTDLLDYSLYRNHENIRFTDQQLELITACTRECFEEIGVLLAVPSSGDVISSGVLAELMSCREAIDHDPSLFGTLLAENQLQIDLGHFLMWANWITPSLVPRRFNAHFLLAPMPPEQTVQCDTAESTEEYWVDLADFTAENGRAIVAMPPTLYPLADLADCLRTYGNLDALFNGERERRIVPVMPKMHRDGEAIRSYMPWHAEYHSIPGEGVNTQELHATYTDYPDIVIPSMKLPGMPKP